MKKFILKSFYFLIIFFLIIEIFSRIIIDPFYFYYSDSYTLRFDKVSLKIFDLIQTNHVDYLFIGSSRVPATINPSVIMNESPDKIVIVGGRGYMTPGVHYQALVNRLAFYPNYLKNAVVCLEYPGSDIYSSSFAEDILKVFEPQITGEKAMPHLLLPHLNKNSLWQFLNISKNSVSVKINMLMLYFISSYRTSIFIKEKFKLVDNVLPFIKSKQKLVSDGGIRNDNIDGAKQKALDVASIESKAIADNPLLTPDILNKSSLANINNIIKNHGGRLFLYRMPLNSIQKGIYNSIKAMQNKNTFEQWIVTQGITVLNVANFHYQDSDFPDTWHLAKERRDEFTKELYKEIKKH
jgi:hypothetical protein